MLVRLCVQSKRSCLHSMHVPNFMPPMNSSAQGTLPPSLTVYGTAFEVVASLNHKSEDSEDEEDTKVKMIKNVAWGWAVSTAGGPGRAP